MRLVDFVKRVTTDRTSDLVPRDRIAVFDNDGTLWPEQPNCIQFIFAFDRLKSLAHVNPGLRKAEPFRTVLEGGSDRLATLDADGIIEIIKATQSGMSTEQFSLIVAEWLATAKDPRFGRVVYQPMLELLDYLGVQDFHCFRKRCGFHSRLCRRNLSHSARASGGVYEHRRIQSREGWPRVDENAGGRSLE
jgi:hypothetical protein